MPPDMPANGARPAAGDWMISGDEIQGSRGTLRVKMIGARGGIPLAELDVWAMSADDLVAFLRGCAEAMAQKYGKIILAGGRSQ